MSGIDISYALWRKGYKVDDRAVTGINNSHHIGIGIEKIPLHSKKERITYRAGIFYGQLNLYANYARIKEYGISLGLGFPLLIQHNRLNVAVQYGQRGEQSKNLAEETFVRFNLSLSTSELWFNRDIR